MATQSASCLLKAVGTAAIFQCKPEQAHGSSGDLQSTSSFAVPAMYSTSIYSKECVLRYNFLPSLASTCDFAIYKLRNHSETNMLLRLELRRGMSDLQFPHLEKK